MRRERWGTTVSSDAAFTTDPLAIPETEATGAAAPAEDWLDLEALDLGAAGVARPGPAADVALVLPPASAIGSQTSSREPPLSRMSLALQNSACILVQADFVIELTFFPVSGHRMIRVPSADGKTNLGPSAIVSVTSAPPASNGEPKTRKKESSN